MVLDELFDKLKTEIKALMGEEGKDKVFASQAVHANDAAASQAFAEAKKRLFDVNKWSDLPGINSTFELHNARGIKKESGYPEVGDYMKIILPGVPLENWVQVADVKQDQNLAEFTAKPSDSPDESNSQTKHFFTHDASTTFRVVQDGNTVKAFEIGKNEVINNQDEEAGSRAIANTLVAEGGWAGFQKLQWQKLTDYLVEKIEVEPA